QGVVDARGGCRLEVVAADRTVYQCADFLGSNLRCFEGSLAAEDAHIARKRTSRPESPLANAGHQLQTAGRQAQAAIERLQAALDLVARHDFSGKRISKRFETDVTIAHADETSRKLLGDKQLRYFFPVREGPSLESPGTSGLSAAQGSRECPKCR